METFDYAALDREGNRLSGSIPANNAREARDLLRARHGLDSIEGVLGNISIPAYDRDFVRASRDAPARVWGLFNCRYVTSSEPLDTTYSVSSAWPSSSSMAPVSRQMAPATSASVRHCASDRSSPSGDSRIARALTIVESVSVSMTIPL